MFVWQLWDFPVVLWLRLCAPNAGGLGQILLEKAYGILIPTLMKLENKQLEDVKTYGEQYLKYFPEGPNVVNIRRIMDDAAKESALKK